MIKHFYARTNPYGNETSAGFNNTMQAVRFESKQERDSFVRDNEDSNMAVCKITAARARQINR